MMTLPSTMERKMMTQFLRWPDQGQPGHIVWDIISKAVGSQQYIFHNFAKNRTNLEQTILEDEYGKYFSNYIDVWDNEPNNSDSHCADWLTEFLQGGQEKVTEQWSGVEWSGVSVWECCRLTLYPAWPSHSILNIILMYATAGNLVFTQDSQILEIFHCSIISPT